MDFTDSISVKPSEQFSMKIYDISYNISWHILKRVATLPRKIIVFKNCVDEAQ